MGWNLPGRDMQIRAVVLEEIKMSRILSPSWNQGESLVGRRQAGQSIKGGDESSFSQRGLEKE